MLFFQNFFTTKNQSQFPLNEVAQLFNINNNTNGFLSTISAY